MLQYDDFRVDRLILGLCSLAIPNSNSTLSTAWHDFSVMKVEVQDPTSQSTSTLGLLLDNCSVDNLH